MSKSRILTAARRLAVMAGLALSALAFPLATRADEVAVAVAANFSAPMKRIAQEFERASGHHVAIVPGATGNLYTQVKNGAPFEVLLAADAATPRRMEDEGLAVAGQRETYAIGKLVLYSAQPGFVDDRGEVLRSARFRHLALANPLTAPYGAAAMETLQALGARERLQAKIVQGESIAQTFQFVASGNAELGFVALSQIVDPDAPGTFAAGSHWIVPAGLYAPIRQDAVLLKAGEHRAGARALMEFLRSDAARAVIRAYGYDLPPR